MILTKLTVNDFGVFQGEHCLDLSPKNRRPIVLFGGKNGSGKSTILEALSLCLYGIGSMRSGTSKEEYLRFLAGKIHRNPSALIQPTFASVQVEFKYSHADGVVTYVVTRSWERRSGTKTSEFLSVERDGNPLAEIEAEHWQEFIRELIPPGVSQLFFFDGEKIQALAEDSTDQQALADAIKSLLGVDIVERLQVDLRTHLSRLVNPKTDRKQLNDIRGLEKTINRLKRRLETARTRRLALDNTLQEIKAEIARVETAFSAQGGSFARNRDQLLQEEGLLRGRISQLEDTIRQHCAGLLPFVLAPDLCEKLQKQLSAEEDVAKVKAGQELIGLAKKEIECRLQVNDLLSDFANAPEELRSSLRSQIYRAIHDPLAVEKCTFPEVLHELSGTTAKLLLGWLRQGSSEVRPQLHSVDQELEKTYRALQEVSERLGKIPADEVLKPILEEIRGLNEKLARASADVLLKDELIRQIEIEVYECERRHSQLTHKLADQAKQSAKLRLLPRVQSTLEEYRLKLIEKKIGQLQEAVTQCFNLLCRKKDSLRTIKIDSRDFSIALCDRQGKPLPKAQLSAGEKQIYAIAMLWALGKTSGRPLPVIIDTPLARLDSDHRKLLVEHYFPLASHQVIILSTDTEVDQSYFEDLRPVIARIFRLDYDQREACTTVGHGYFWRERDEAYQAAAN